jgi:hypothetical protein
MSAAPRNGRPTTGSSRTAMEASCALPAGVQVTACGPVPSISAVKRACTSCWMNSSPVQWQRGRRCPPNQPNRICLSPPPMRALHQLPRMPASLPRLRIRCRYGMHCNLCLPPSCWPGPRLCPQYRAWKMSLRRRPSKTCRTTLRAAEEPKLGSASANAALRSHRTGSLDLAPLTPLTSLTPLAPLTPLRLQLFPFAKSSSSPASSRTGILSSCALSSFDPASSPATT